MNRKKLIESLEGLGIKVKGNFVSKKQIEKALAFNKAKENVVTVYYSAGDSANVTEKATQAAKKYNGVRVGSRGITNKDLSVSMCDFEFSDMEDIPKFKEEIKRIIGFGFVS